MAGKRVLATTQPRWQVATNDKSVWRMMRAAMKRVRVAGVMVTAMRVVSNKEGKGGKGCWNP